MEIDYDLWDDISVLSSDIADLEDDGHSPQFKEIVYPVLVAKIREMLNIDVPVETIQSVGRPRKITGAFRDYILRCHNNKMSSREISAEIEKLMGIKIHFNTILNFFKDEGIPDNKTEGETNE